MVRRAMTTGTIADPFTLSQALASALILPGHTLYLRGGTYNGVYTSTLAGSQAQPITIRPYGTEKPIIDGALTINGSDTIWQDIEIMYSGWLTRRTEQTGSTPADLPIDKSLNIYGPRTTMRRCSFHDLAGPGFWTPAVDGVLDECLSYNNGWDAPDRGHGHGLYSQNAIGTKTIKRCVFPMGYSDYSIHCYTQGGSIQGFVFEECVSIARICLIGGGTPVDRLTMTRCMLWGGTLQTGYSAGVQNGNATLTDTILANGAGRVIAGIWSNLEETGTNTTTGDRILVYGGLVIVFNQAQAASVTAPIAGRYINCQNPAESITVQAGAVLPMIGWTVAPPIAGAGPLETFDPRFAVFLVEPSIQAANYLPMIAR